MFVAKKCFEIDEATSPHDQIKLKFPKQSNYDIYYDIAKNKSNNYFC